MGTLFDARDRESILGRVGRLTSESRPLWGRFTAPEMVCHVSTGLRQGLREADLGPPVGPLNRAPLNWRSVESPAAAGACFSTNTWTITCGSSASSVGASLAAHGSWLRSLVWAFLEELTMRMRALAATMFVVFLSTACNGVPVEGRVDLV